MKNLELISFEIVNCCNLSYLHPWCPSNSLLRYDDAATPPMSDNDIIRFIRSALAHGFIGKIAYHYYCEPTQDLPRCQRLAVAIKALGLRSVLWTNGTCRGLPEGIFDEIFVTAYGLGQEGITRRIEYRPDDRLQIYDIEPLIGITPCYRPAYLEMPITFYGDVRLCCADWRGTVKIGNIITNKHSEIFTAWRNIGKLAIAGTPEICRRCHALAKTPGITDGEFRIWR